MIEKWQGDFINDLMKDIYRFCKHNERGLCKNHNCDQYGEFVDAQFCREICPQYERREISRVEED